MTAQTARILVVDNDAGRRESLVKSLRDAGYDTRTADSAQECFEALATEMPDLIILEANLPDLSGIEVCRRLKQDTRTSIVPIIQISAPHAGSQDRVSALECGADAYLGYPFEYRELQAHVRGLLRVHNAENALRLRAAFSQDVLNSVSAHIAVLDHNGMIIAVNDAWLRFAAENGATGTNKVAVGVNYLEVCRRAATTEEGGRALEGIKEVMSGSRTQYSMEYACHSPAERRWFLMNVTPPTTGIGGAIVSHVDITSQKSAEQQLRDSEARYRALAEHLPGGAVFIFDQNLRFLAAEGAALVDAGLTTADLVGKTIFEALDADLVWRYEPTLRGALAGESFRVEHKARGRHFRSHGVPLRDKAGQVHSVLVASYDITSRKRMEERMRRAHGNLESILRSITDAFFALNRDWCFTFVNAEAERMLRKTASSLLGQNVWDLFPKAEAFRARYEQAVATGRADHFEEYYAPLEAWFEVHAFPRGDGLSIYFRDVTIRRKADEVLRQSEFFYRQTLESIPGMVFTTRPDGYCDYQSQQWVQYTGVPVEEHLGAGWNKLLHPDDRSRAYNAWLAAVAEQSPYDLEYRVRRWDGQYEWFKVIGRPIRDPSGRIVRWFGVAANIDRLKQVEQDLQEARRSLQQHADNLECIVKERTSRLQELVGELEHLSYTITHDMRAPLRAMRGFAQLIQEMSAPTIPPEVRTFLQRIMSSAERMDLLITEALNYTRAVRQDLPLVPIDAGALLRGLIDTYPEFQTNRAFITIEGVIPRVLGNEAALTQCFSNLLGNAVKFVKPGEKPDVRVRAELIDNNSAKIVRIWVEDRGVGISEAMLPRVFDMFARGSRQYEGTGIGLALVRKVVQRMGGRVGVDSVLGKGSRFWVDLQAGEPNDRQSVAIQ